jgi:hypothetical protein
MNPIIRRTRQYVRRHSSAIRKDFATLEIPETTNQLFVFSLRSLFWKIKLGFLRSPCCLCVCKSSPVNLWIPEPVSMEHGTYILATKSVSTAYFINSSHQCVCLCVYHTIAAGQELCKKSYHGNEYTQQYKNCARRHLLCGLCPIERN